MHNGWFIYPTVGYLGSFKTEILPYLRSGGLDISRTPNKIVVRITTIIAKISQVSFMCQALFLTLYVYQQKSCESGTIAIPDSNENIDVR